MKNILFFIHRYNDIDHFSAIIHFLSNSNQDVNITIISLFPSKGYEFDKRIIHLTRKNNVNYFNFTNLCIENYFYKFLNFIAGKGVRSGSLMSDIKFLFKKKFSIDNLLRVISNLSAYFLLKFNLYNYVIRFFYSSKWTRNVFENLKPSLIVIDHAISTGPQRNLQPIKSIIKLAKKNNLNIISFPHGVPLFKFHPRRYDSIKKNISRDISNSLIMQHKNWLNECLEFGLDNNKVKIFGIPRFFHKWEKELHSIYSSEPLLNKLGKEKIKIVFMDTGPNNYGKMINKVIDTVENLSKNKDVHLIYKPHTRNHVLNLPYLNNVSYFKEINSINLIKWADIIIGSSSSIMIECLYQKKLYVSPSYFRENHMIFEEYSACLELKTYKSFLEFSKNITQISLNPYDHYREQDVWKFYNDIVYNGSKEQVVIKELIEHIINLSNEKLLN
tara:strand:- start:655 stop:1986 length:1332 start_codon:yes stop_codon:yes gene_type:complete